MAKCEIVSRRRPEAVKTSALVVFPKFVSRRRPEAVKAASFVVFPIKVPILLREEGRK